MADGSLSIVVATVYAPRGIVEVRGCASTSNVRGSRPTVNVRASGSIANKRRSTDVMCCTDGAVTVNTNAPAAVDTVIDTPPVDTAGAVPDSTSAAAARSGQGHERQDVQR